VEEELKKGRKWMGKRRVEEDETVEQNCYDLAAVLLPSLN
jgi:hypothetical protein